MRTSPWIPIALSLVLGCKQKPSGDEQPGAGAVEYDAELGRRFEAAAQGLEQRDAAAPGAWAWTLPSCELEYAFRVTLDMTVVGEEMPGSGLTIFGSWTARGEGSRMILRNGDVTIAHLSDGARRPGMTEAAGKLAEIRLETDGRRWTEVDGPTSLWSAYGSWYGLTTFYPALPEGTAAAAASDWPITIFDRSGGGKVEAERGSLELPEGTELPEPETETVHAHVELQRWIELAGRRAAVLRSRSDHDGGGPLGGMGLLGGMKAERSGQGQFVVSADGVLIHAEQRDRTEVKMRMGTKTMEQLHVLVAEARLLRDCNGPVLPEFPDDRSPSERALEAVAALRNHAAAGEQAQIEALLDPELVAAHPEAAGCLIGFAKRYGPTALGMPELPAGDQIRQSGSAVDLRLHARLDAVEGEEPEGSGDIEYALQVEGERERVVAIRLRRFGDEGPWLWIEPHGELISAADCGDMPPPLDDPLLDDDEPPTVVDEP